MKTSKVMIFGVIAATALLVVAFAVTARIVLERSYDGLDSGGPSVRASEEYVTRSYELSEFSSVRLEGGWRLEVSEDAEETVASYPENISEYLVVEIRGSTLVLSVDSRHRIRGLDVLTAVVPSDNIRSVDGAGALDVTLSGLDAPRFSIKGAGVLTGRATDCVIDELELVSDGAADVDFSNIRVNDADVRISGAGNVKLDLEGGALTGSLSGAVTVSYTGTAERVEVDTSGASKVRKIR